VRQEKIDGTVGEEKKMPIIDRYLTDKIKVVLDKNPDDREDIAREAKDLGRRFPNHYDTAQSNLARLIHRRLVMKTAPAMGLGCMTNEIIDHALNSIDYLQLAESYLDEVFRD
jgi:hypothetical protein